MAGGLDLMGEIGSANKRSMEQIKDLIDRGYEYLEENDSISAIVKWLRGWEAIKVGVKPAFKDLDYLEKHYEGRGFIGGGPGFRN